MPEYSGRFESTVPYYARFRPRYPAALFELIATQRKLDGRGRLLDLGCGPGFIAIGMTPYFAEVVGVDPEPAMLEAARQEAERAHVALTLIPGSSQHLAPRSARSGWRRWDARSIGWTATRRWQRSTR